MTSGAALQAGAPPSKASSAYVRRNPCALVTKVPVGATSLHPGDKPNQSRLRRNT